MKMELQMTQQQLEQASKEKLELAEQIKLRD